MDRLIQLADNIEELRLRIYNLINNPNQAPDPEVIKLNHDLDRLIVEYTRLSAKDVPGD